MKKILILISFVILFIFTWFASAYNLSENEKTAAKKIAEKIANIVNNQTPRYKNAWKVKLENLLNKLEINTKYYALVSEILTAHQQMDFSKYITNHYNAFHINQNTIENYWLKLHNNAREERNLSLYSYDKRLNNTAIEWSHTNYEKKIIDHKRNTNDSWYDYNKIENWFQERWVHCKIKWWTTSSESIWKYWFYCRDWECSEELSISLKEIFDIYMAEETLSYPANAHYKAIISPNISKVWLWISLYQSDLPDYYEYYMTTHYCTEFK